MQPCLPLNVFLKIVVANASSLICGDLLQFQLPKEDEFLLQKLREEAR